MSSWIWLWREYDTIQLINSIVLYVLLLAYQNVSRISISLPLIICRKTGGRSVPVEYRANGTLLLIRPFKVTPHRGHLN